MKEAKRDFNDILARLFCQSIDLEIIACYCELIRNKTKILHVPYCVSKLYRANKGDKPVQAWIFFPLSVLQLLQLLTCNELSLRQKWKGDFVDLLRAVTLQLLFTRNCKINTINFQLRLS